MEHDESDTRQEPSAALVMLKLQGIECVASLLVEDFQRWCQRWHLLCRSMIKLAIEDCDKTGQGDLAAKVQSRFGPAVVHNQQTKAFMAAWTELPAELFGASCAAMVVEAAASAERCRPRLHSIGLGDTTDLMEIVTFGTVDCADFLDARQRRRVWGGTLEGRLAALERHLGGSSYSWFEFLAHSSLYNLCINFLRAWCQAEDEAAGRGRHTSGGAPDGGVLQGLGLMKVLEEHMKAGTRPPPRITLQDGSSSGGSEEGQRARGCPCCGQTPGGAGGSGPSSASAVAAQQAQQAPPPEGPPSGWRVAQLRAFLAARGVESRHCIEKSQLVELAVAELAPGSAAAAPAEEEAAAPEEGAPAAAPLAEAGAGAAGAAGAAPLRQCAECGATRSTQGTKLLKCSGCRVVYYCSTDCQGKAWPQHRRACRGKSAAQ